MLKKVTKKFTVSNVMKIILKVFNGFFFVCVCVHIEVVVFPE